MSDEEGAKKKKWKKRKIKSNDLQHRKKSNVSFISSMQKKNISNFR